MTVMNIYACGGAGINIGSSFSNVQKTIEKGFASLNLCFVDTSKSNVAQTTPSDQIYLVEGLDGSGKLRNSNYSILSEKSREIMHKFKPADVNIVLHSASGGSGSVLGPILVSEMLARGELVIAMVVGSTGSRIETENTLKTLKSYETISKKREMPVAAFYRENSPNKPRGHVDSEIQNAIFILAAIFSGQNRELDTADLRNFINYDKVTSYSPRLTSLDFFSKEIIISKGQSLVSVVTIADDNSDSEISIPVEYQTVGFFHEDRKKSLTVEMPIHACMVAGYFNQAVELLDNKLKQYDEARNVYVDKSIVKDSSGSTDEGLVL
jgi:hypothetical protein